MEFSFDKAIELLEITDISKIKIDDLPQIEKKLKKRWHPDRVSHLNDNTITEEYTLKFQQIELASQMIFSFLNGTFQAGDSFTQNHNTVQDEPEEIIRKNAPEIQTTLKNLWTSIKNKRYKRTVKEVILSDGFSLKELLDEDFKEDIAMLSIISFLYGQVFLGLLTVIAGIISPFLVYIVGLVWFLQSISCLLGFAPLSRFWLNERISEYMYKFINFGLGIYYWAENQLQTSTNTWLILFIRIPLILAKFVKYIIMYPLYEIAKLIVGKKVVGVVMQDVNYYADAAEWYIDLLLDKDSNQMSKEELFHLSYIYSELVDVKAN